MLNQVADGVWVRQSEWVWSNAVVVRGEGGLILVDPGIDGSDLDQLADDLDRLGIPVVAGFSTHPHWDHLLWHSRFGDAPRYATPACAQAASEARVRAQRTAAESASGIPLELIRLITPLPADGGPVPGEIVEHQAHAIGHAAVLLADRGVLLAGDMLSDVLIPLLDPRRPDQVGAYETALDRLGEAASHIEVLVPGHGAVAEADEVAVTAWAIASLGGSALGDGITDRTPRRRVANVGRLVFGEPALELVEMLEDHLQAAGHGHHLKHLQSAVIACTTTGPWSAATNRAGRQAGRPRRRAVAPVAERALGSPGPANPENPGGAAWCEPRQVAETPIRPSRNRETNRA